MTTPDIPTGEWYTSPHMSRGPHFEIAGQLVEAMTALEVARRRISPGRTTEWHVDLLERRWPGVTFKFPEMYYFSQFSNPANWDMSPHLICDQYTPAPDGSCQCENCRPQFPDVRVGIQDGMVWVNGQEVTAPPDGEEEVRLPTDFLEDES